MLLLVAFIVISLGFKRPFVHGMPGWYALNKSLIGDPVTNWFGRQFVLPRWLDIPLRGVKHLLLSSLYRVIDARSGDSLFYAVALQRGDGR